jgi:hypothetical protein
LIAVLTPASQAPDQFLHTIYQPTNQYTSPV